MADHYIQLIKDHINITHVLNLLQKEVDQNNAEGWTQPNLPLILDVLDYIQAYPERYHHPLEEAVFDYLLDHQLGDKQAIQTIREQHANLEKETHYLQVGFTQLANRQEGPHPKLCRRLDDFISYQYDHINAENSEIFPVIAELTEEAWWDITSCMVLRNDPLFDDPKESEFSVLLAQIDKDLLYGVHAVLDI